jgi:hypothetical protein
MKITRWLQRHSLIPIAADPNLFFYRKEKQKVILILYVDDLLLTGNDTQRIS